MYVYVLKEQMNRIIATKRTEHVLNMLRTKSQMINTLDFLVLAKQQSQSQKPRDILSLNHFNYHEKFLRLRLRLLKLKSPLSILSLVI